MTLDATLQPDYRQIFESTPQPMWILDLETLRFLAVNDAAISRYGFARAEFLSMSAGDLAWSEGSTREHAGPTMTPLSGHHAGIRQHRRRDGGLLEVELSTHPIDFGKRAAILVAAQDVTERRRAEGALRRSEEYRRAIIETEPACVKVVGSTGALLDMNPAGLAMLEAASLEEGAKQSLLDYVLPEYRRQFAELHERVMQGGSGHLEFEIEGLKGTRRTLETFAVPLRDEAGGVTALLGVTHDVTQRKREAAERERLQTQVLQAQKMESIGRLAGGVAHDFNNMLGVILGHAELAMRDTAPGSELSAELSGILRAARRSSDLTHQLLAFARKQTVAPRVINLNQGIGDVLAMLSRLLGEEIRLIWSPATNLWPVRFDPAQIDQILVNFAANARDAIAGIGTLTIETSNQVVAPTARDSFVGCDRGRPGMPGEYVVLTVHDDGRGMTPEVLEHVFEPFYTTKELGQGTGLGLATVYGIVRQNGGCIEVSSAPGAGTTFRVYLPRAEGAVVDSTGDPFTDPADTPRGRGERILLVEDEPSLLALDRTMLEELGYSVLAAETPSEALRLASGAGEAINLLLTDVILPEMSGRELAHRLTEVSPGLRCVYMSGYTADVLAPNGHLEPGVRFLAKPFTMGDLATKVRAALE
ncbi:MAG: PAS domain S-box protein [Candidatus Eisenbacteria bacterium]